MRILFFAALLAAFSAHSETDWPKRDIHIFVGFSAGGTTDIISRLIANELSRAWGQPIVIENKAGATGNIAADYVAKSQADGYTLLMGSVGPLAINASLFKSMPYDNLRDLAPVTLVAHVPNMLVVHPRLPVRSFQELIQLIKANPGKYFYASTGSGTASHLAAELLKMQAGLDLTHVPYKGAVALNDVLAGESVHLMFATIPSVIGHMKNGRLKGLAVTSLKRSASAPELPTIAESGYPGFDASSWFGLVGPAGLAEEIRAKVAGEVARSLKRPDLRDKFLQQGADPVGSTPQEFAQYMSDETAKWAKLVKAVGATVD